MQPRGKRFRSAALWLLALGAFGYWGYRVVTPRNIWTRKHPLAHPIQATDVHDGVITLADGRQFRPAGIAYCDGLSAKDIDPILKVIVAQGVEVLRDLGDGRAFLQAEPKFYNWCGTVSTSMFGSTWWAGGYFQSPVSELLIWYGCAMPQLDQPGLSSRERWRLQGVIDTFTAYDAPPALVDRLNALRFSGGLRDLGDLDNSLPTIVGPLPKP